jgi:hypothetical protein
LQPCVLLRKGAEKIEKIRVEAILKFLRKLLSVIPRFFAITPQAAIAAKRNFIFYVSMRARVAARNGDLTGFNN